MREPARASRRLIGMKFLLIALALVLSGCGNTADPQDDPAKKGAEAPTQVGECNADDAALTSAKKVGVADLGLGEAQVALTAADAPCPNMIFTRAPGGTAYVELDYKPAAAQVIRVGDAQLVAVRQDHARGGFQQHLYAVRGATLSEISRAGNPLLPFVALDTAGQPHAFADCDKDGLRVLEPAATEPPGVMMGWDVFATTYTFSDGEAAPSPRVRIEHSVPDGQVESTHPELFNDTWFAHCR